MTKFRKILILGVVATTLVATVFLVWFLDTTKKITTYEDCASAGWLVRSIGVYDGFNLFPNKYECVLWGGKKFEKQEVKSAHFFPTRKKPSIFFHEALLSGTLEEVNGCLRVRGNLIVWRYGFSLITDEEGVVQVIDNAGQLVARVGDEVRFGGSGFNDKDEIEDGMKMADILNNISAEFPSNRCSGPYWNLGEIVK